MEKKYIVRLTDEERETLRDVIKRLKGSSQKVRRAQVLLKADADGPAWTDKQIAEAFGCRTKTVENIRQRLVLEGFAVALEGKRPAAPPSTALPSGSDRGRWGDRKRSTPRQARATSCGTRRDGWRPARSRRVAGWR